MRNLALHRQEVCSLDKRHFNRPRRRLTHRACKPATRKAPCLALPDGPGFKQDFETMLDMANSLRHDPEKPVFHVMPRHGWVSQKSETGCTPVTVCCSYGIAGYLFLVPLSDAQSVYADADKRPQWTCVL